MITICKKEINKFFSTLTGYMAIVLFMLVCGTYLFVLPSSSILDNNYATLQPFFDLAPWVLLFLIPAITMHSFADEYKAGTFEILQTRPLTTKQIIAGKYLAILVIIIIVVIPTIIYFFCIKFLSANNNIDAGAITASYLGLIFLAAVFAAISLCCSAFTSNAVVAFLISSFMCLCLYFGFNAISQITIFKGNADYFIEMFGIDFHYNSISRGVIDTRDVCYFLSIIFLSLLITYKKISLQ